MPGNPDKNEAAAIAAAVKRFQVETAAPAEDGQQKVGHWQRAALIEGVGKRVTIEDLEGEGGTGWLS